VVTVLQETWFPIEARSVSAARRAIRRFPGPLDTATRQDAELLTSELVGNAVAGHSRGRLCLRMRSWNRRLRVEVTQPGPDSGFLVGRDPGEAEIMLRMLDAISGDWGHGPAGTGGSTAWFELPTRPSPR
jgi:anti-sigma regulatory factor (Ser/Thr protein kinase)